MQFMNAGMLIDIRDSETFLYGSMKPDLYVCVKLESILHMPGYSQSTMKSNAWLIQSSPQECVGGVLKQ